MPKLTIDLSDEAYALLTMRAQYGDAPLEAEAVHAVERALVMSLPGGWESWRELLTALTTIKGFISTLLMDEDGTMFAHSDRLEFYEIIDRECDRLKTWFEPFKASSNGAFTFRARPTRLREVLEAVRDQAQKSPFRKPTHKFVLEVGGGVHETILTDAEALRATLWTFLESAMEHSPLGSEIHVIIRRKGTDALFFLLSDQSTSVSPEFVARFSQASSPPRPKLRSIGASHFYRLEQFIQWHGGTWETHSYGVGTSTRVSFTLRLFREDFSPINEDPRYYEMVAALRQSCLRLLAEAEQLPKIHLHFDGKARKALSESLQKEAETLQALVKSLQTITTPLVPQTDEPAPLGDQPP